MLSQAKEIKAYSSCTPNIEKMIPEEMDGEKHACFA